MPGSPTDRRHQNWGVLVDTRTDAGHLAPSFDHGSSLGFSLRPDRLEILLSDPAQVDRWCARGRNVYFAGKPLLLDVATQALRLAGTRAEDSWLSRLAAVRADDWRSLIDRIPAEKMSDQARTFVDGLLDVNRRRLLDVRR